MALLKIPSKRYALNFEWQETRRGSVASQPITLPFSTESSRIRQFDFSQPSGQQTTSEASDIPITIPEPHGKQIEILQSTAKRKVINAGRRGGKTTLAAMVSVQKFKDGRRVLLSSTTQDQADAFWEKITDWLKPWTQVGIVKKNETKRTLTMVNGKGRIKVKTAWDADTLRGDYADFLVLDECSRLQEEAWTKVGAPMLLDNDGDAWFISTPNRRNWFFKLFQRAKADGVRWAAFHFTSYDNPHLSPEALAELQADMTEDDIKEEILAEFLEGSGTVFHNIPAALHAPLVHIERAENRLTAWGDKAAHEGHDITGGLDWGQKNDYTVLSLACVTCGVEVFLDRFNLNTWATQREHVKAAYTAWSVFGLLAEANSIGGPNIEALVTEDDLAMTPFDTTSASKPGIIKALKLAFEKAKFQWLDVPEATAELEAYEGKQNANTYRMAYSAPEGMHDDTVIARALALRAALSAGGSVTWLE